MRAPAFPGRVRAATLRLLLPSFVSRTRSALARSLPALACLVLAGLAPLPSAWAARDDAPRRAQAARIAPAAATAAPMAAPARPKRPAIVDGDAEARLIAIYQLIGEGESARALADAEKLTADYPNFQLGQLVYGDLLAQRIRIVRTLGDLPDHDAAQAAPLAALRHESDLRLKALRERPPAGAVPAQFVQLSASSRHAIAIDTSRARLYLFENTDNGLKLLADYYISVGKSGIEKSVEGDMRTPLGVYYITSNLDPRTLKPFYGAGALPINYPNPYDMRLGKTGGGIWLHGTPADQFSRAPLATDGCVVIANPDLRRILGTVAVRSTPVVIAERLLWVPPQAARAAGKSFEDVFENWRAAKSAGDMAALMPFYAPDFNSYGKSLEAWRAVVQQDIARAQGRPVRAKDLSMLRWQHETTETMVVTFGEVPEGVRTGPVRRQYWMRTPHGPWQIFFEGTIG